MEFFINLKHYVNDNNLKHVLSGVSYGKKVRRRMKLKKMLKRYDKVHIMIPEHIFIIEKDFIIGLLNPFIKKHKDNIFNKVGLLILPNEKFHTIRKKHTIDRFEQAVSLSLNKNKLWTPSL